MLVTSKEEPDPERVQATPVQLHTGVLEFHLLVPTTLERFIKMRCTSSGGRGGGASAAAAMGAW